MLYIRDQIKGLPQSELDARLGAIRHVTTTDDYDPK
jgi:hypothetical protein